nr:PsbP-related protein [uncultured Psychroserpens sp.]
MKLRLTTLALVFMSNIVFAQDEWKTLEKENYSISYPTTWEHSDKKPQPSTQFVLFSEVASQEKDSFRENINLSTENLNGQNPSLSDYTRVSLDQVKAQVPTAKIVASSTTKVNGIDVSDITWSATFGAIDLKFRQFLFIKNGTAYILTYTGSSSEFDNYSKVVNTTFNSFKFTK